MSDDPKTEFTTRKCTVRSFDPPANAKNQFDPLWNLRVSEGECLLSPDGKVCQLTMDEEIEIRLGWRHRLFIDGDSKDEEVWLVADGTRLVLGIPRFLYRLLPGPTGR